MVTLLEARALVAEHAVVRELTALGEAHYQAALVQVSAEAIVRESLPDRVGLASVASEAVTVVYGQGSRDCGADGQEVLLTADNIGEFKHCAVLQASLRVHASLSPRTLHLPNLARVEGDLLQLRHLTLRDMQGFPKLQSVGGALRLEQLPMLESLQGLQRPQSVGALVLKESDGLLRLDGLLALHMVGTQLTLENCLSLEAVSGLCALQSAQRIATCTCLRARWCRTRATPLRWSCCPKTRSRPARPCASRPR